MDDAEVARAAAERGAAIVRDRFGGTHRRLAKAGLDFATDVDIETERAIIEALRRHRPADDILGEESGLVSGTAGSRTWLVDPLCGTANFAAGVPAVAVNVALGGASAAAVADPLAGEVYVAAEASARLVTAAGEAPLTPSGGSRLVDIDLDQRPIPTGFDPPALIADAEFRAAFEPRATATSLALAWVATGRLAAYLTDADLADNVHFAAGVAVCLAAGCTVSDLQGRSLAPGSAGSGLIAAGDKVTHEHLLAMVQRVAGSVGQPATKEPS